MISNVRVKLHGGEFSKDIQSANDLQQPETVNEAED